ncbi:MAG: hypothetical protein ACOY0T_15300 [Myxococcota bacterium]
MRKAAFALWLLVGVGCASKTPQAVAPDQAATKPGSALEGEAAPDLSPVAAPDDLVALGRLARPRSFVETLANWSGFPLRVTDMLPSDAQVLKDVVAWDAPLEVAAVLDRHSSEKVAAPQYVVSVGLSSIASALSAAKDKGYEATRVSPSVYRVPLSDDVFCAISAAAGSAPARLVCSANWQNVEELLPYATRGLPREDFRGRDLHLALKPGPLQRRYAQEIGALPLLVGMGLRQLQTDSPRLDRALADAAYGLAGELKTLAMQLDGFELSARLDENAKSLDLGYSFGFAKDEAFVAQLLQDAGRRSVVPPDVFWDMPRTSVSGQYGVGLDPKRLAQLTTPLAEIADAFLEQHKAATTYRSRVRSVIDSLSSLFVGGAHVAGVVPPPKEITMQGLFASNLGWRVGVSETRADKIFKLLTDAEALLADRETAKLLKKALPNETIPLPKLRHKVVKVAGFPTRATEFIIELPPALFDKVSEKKGLPKGIKDSKKPMVASLVLVPDGEHTWFGLAAEEKAAIGALETARAGREGKLRDVAELAPLKEKPAISSGFFSLEALFASFASLARAADFDSEAALARAPNHGKSPWISRVEHVPSGAGLRVNASIRVPRQAFEDIAGVLPALIAMGKSGPSFEKVPEEQP